MNKNTEHKSCRWLGARKGVTLIELLLALSVTAMVGLGVASMLSMISSSTQDTRNARSLLLRAHAGQIRMRSYLDSSLQLLSHDEEKGLVSWLLDQRTEDQINLSEIRVFWFDQVNETLTVEWVSFPENWTELQIQAFDTVIPDGSDYFTVMETQRAASMTASLDLVEDVRSLRWEFNEAVVTDATRVTMQMDLVMDEDEDPQRTLSTFGLSNHVAAAGG